MDNEHARVGAVLVDDVLEEDGALLRGGHGTERQLDGVNVVVDGLGQADDGEAVLVPLEERREVGGSRVGVVSANGVQNRNTILHELVGGDLLRVLAFLHEAALDAVLHVGELDSAVSNWGSTAVDKDWSQSPNLGGHLHVFALEQALRPHRISGLQVKSELDSNLIAVNIANHLDFRVIFVINLNEVSDT